MGIYGGIENAKYSEGGVYLEEGVHSVKILACKTIKTRQNDYGFVAELEIVESTNPKHLPGSQCSWMVMLKHSPAMGNIRQFIATAAACMPREGAPHGVADVDISQVTEEVVERVTKETPATTASPGEPNPLKGILIRATATTIKTKGKGADFTKVKWMPYVTSAAEMAEAKA